MPTLNLQVAASLDDATSYEGYGFLLDHIISIAGKDGGGLTISCGMRFLNVGIPQGSTINVAYLTFRVPTDRAVNTCNTTIDGEDADDAATFSTLADYLARARTTASVAWNSIPGWYAGNDYNSPSIVSVIQEIVDRAGWVSGNDLVVFWNDNGSSTGANRSGNSYDGNPTYCVKLHIEFTPPSQTICPSGLSQPISYGTPSVSISGIVISPQGIAVIISYGTPDLRYPQTILPSGLSVPIAYGTPSIVIVGEGVIYVPGHQQPIAYGVPSLLKYVWHAILDGRYSTGTLEVNRAYVIGRDASGNPVYGAAVDSTELGLVGERLDFQQELAIPTETQAQQVANAILAKMGLTGKSGVILIPPNCGQELFDVVQVTDSRGNQSAAKYRVVGLRFEYNPKQARYHHKLILGAP